MIADLAPYQQKDLQRLREWIPQRDEELATMSKVELVRAISSARNSCSMQRSNERRARARKAWREGEVRRPPRLI